MSISLQKQQSVGMLPKLEFDGFERLLKHKRDEMKIARLEQEEERSTELKLKTFLYELEHYVSRINKTREDSRDDKVEILKKVISMLLGKFELIVQLASLEELTRAKTREFMVKDLGINDKPNGLTQETEALAKVENFPSGRGDVVNNGIDKLLKLLNENDWRIKKEGLEGLEQIIATRIHTIERNNMKDLIAILQNRLDDENNKKLKKSFIIFIGNLAEALGSNFKCCAEPLIKKLVRHLADKQSGIKEEILATLDKFAHEIGSELIINYAFPELSEKNQELRFALIGWILRNQEGLAKVNMKPYIGIMISVLQDKNKEVRVLGERLLEKSIGNAGLSEYVRALKSLKPEIQKTLTPLVQKYAEKRPTMEFDIKMGQKESSDRKKVQKATSLESLDNITRPVSNPLAINRSASHDMFPIPEHFRIRERRGSMLESTGAPNSSRTHIPASSSAQNSARRNSLITLKYGGHKTVSQDQNKSFDLKEFQKTPKKTSSASCRNTRTSAPRQSTGYKSRCADASNTPRKGERVVNISGGAVTPRASLSYIQADTSFLNSSRSDSLNISMISQFGQMGERKCKWNIEGNNLKMYNKPLEFQSVIAEEDLRFEESIKDWKSFFPKCNPDTESKGNGETPQTLKSDENVAITFEARDNPLSTILHDLTEKVHGRAEEELILSDDRGTSFNIFRKVLQSESSFTEETVIVTDWER